MLGTFSMRLHAEINAFSCGDDSFNHRDEHTLCRAFDLYCSCYRLIIKPIFLISQLRLLPLQFFNFF